MKIVECSVCGVTFAHNGTREDDSARDHLVAEHPDIDPRPDMIRALFREVKDNAR